MKPFHSRLALTSALAGALALASTAWSQTAPRYTEPFRPQYHFTPEANWMNDPNGMVYFDSEYHLFYQYNPFGDKWGHMSWGHAVSEDLVHWEHLPVAIPEKDGVAAFSGSAVVDWQNTSGFGDGTRPPLVAIYTGWHELEGKLQTQNLAYSLDRGRTWTPYAGNPVLDIKSTEFRDPKVFWYQPGGYWVMAVVLAKEYKVSFYRSADLRAWTLLSHFGPVAATGGVWECPDLFELSVTGREGESKWVLIVNIGDGAIAGGSGGQYFIGEFDGTRFRSDTVNGRVPTRWLDFGRDFYATVTWSDVPATDGRRLAIGWMNNWKYAETVPTSPWRSAQSLVRELSLVRDNDGLHLVQSPVCEYQKLREAPRALHDLALRPETVGLRELGLADTALELAVVFEPGDAAGFGLDVAAGPEHCTRIGYDLARGVLFIDGTNSGPEFDPGFAGRHEAPVALRNGRLDLRVFLDGSLLEVFADGGRVTISDQVFPPPGHDEVALYAKGGTARHGWSTCRPGRSAPSGACRNRPCSRPRRAPRSCRIPEPARMNPDSTPSGAEGHAGDGGRPAGGDPEKAGDRVSKERQTSGCASGKLMGGSTSGRTHGTWRVSLRPDRTSTPGSSRRLTLGHGISPRCFRWTANLMSAPRGVTATGRRPPPPSFGEASERPTLLAGWRLTAFRAGTATASPRVGRGGTPPL